MMMKSAGTKRPKSGKKCDVDFLFESHDKVSFKEIKACLKNIPEQDLWFRQESMILHVACRTIENAQKILDISNEAGFKHSGIITTNSESNIIENIHENLTQHEMRFSDGFTKPIALTKSSCSSLIVIAAVFI